MSFVDYLRCIFGDELGRRNRAFLSDVLLICVITCLLFSAAFFGDRYGTAMANRAVAGYSSVENPDVVVAQRVALRLKTGSALSHVISDANRAGRLNVVWQTDNSITVVAPEKWDTKAPSLSVATVLKDSLLGIDITRSFVMPKRHITRSPRTNTSVPVFEIALGLAVLLATVIFAIVAYLSTRKLVVGIEPLSASDIDALQLPQPYAQRAQCAIAYGKDLRILRRTGKTYETTIIRNSAFQDGCVLRWTPAEVSAKGLKAWVKARFVQHKKSSQTALVEK